MQKKEKINLTDAIVRKLRPEDGEWRSDITPGLLIRIRSMDSKVWYFRYRPKGKEPQKFVFGNFKILSVRGARNRVKKTYSDLLDNIDPIESRKQWDNQPILGDAIKGWYASTLTVKGGYRKNTIKAIKASFSPWIFRKTNDLNIRKHFGQIEDIRTKKLNDITQVMMENFHKTISSKSPYVANRVIQYLKIFFYHAIEKGICNNNPCKIKNKKLNQEIAYDDFLDEVELERVMENAIQKDDRTGRLLKSHYKKNKLNPVPCCLLAFQFATARRPHDEASSLKWEQVIGLNSGQCRVKLKQTKTSKHDTPLIFPIADEAHNILKLIATKNKL